MATESLCYGNRTFPTTQRLTLSQLQLSSIYLIFPSPFLTWFVEIQTIFKVQPRGPASKKALRTLAAEQPLRAWGSWGSWMQLASCVSFYFNTCARAQSILLKVLKAA